MMIIFAYIRRCLYVAFVLGFSFPVQGQATSSDLDVAEQAIQRATQTNADQYAPSLINQARQLLIQAQHALLDRDQRKQAPLIAQRAAVDADLATARSQVAMLQIQVEQRNAEVMQLQRTLGTGEAK
ncbi:MAG TPA: DUF4398 domain-containing protein [Xylella sp.]